jgi:hypothetical protein
MLIFLSSRLPIYTWPFSADLFAKIVEPKYFGPKPGLPDCFQTKNPNLGKFWRVLLWKIIPYFMTIWSILRPLEIFFGHLVYFVEIWSFYPFWYFGPRKIWQSFPLQIPTYRYNKTEANANVMSQITRYRCTVHIIASPLSFTLIWLWPVICYTLKKDPWVVPRYPNIDLPDSCMKFKHFFRPKKTSTRYPGGIRSHDP